MTSAVVNASADSMGRWIDDLAVEQVDTDGDGTLETTLYPVTDLLGSVQLLTDDAGTPVERITYDPDGTPHFWSADTTRPRVTRIAWTGDGALPTGDTVTAQAFEIGLSEAIDPASLTAATATLTAEGGEPQRLTLTLAPDGRTAYLTGATIEAGTTYTLHLEGLTDTSHNPLWPEDATFTVTDAATYQILDDTTSPTLLAVLDTAGGLYLLFDEPVEPAPGFGLDNAVTLTRQGQPVAGTASRLGATVLAWHPDGPSGWLPGGDYTLAALHLQDLAGNPITAPTPTLTHLATSDRMLLLAYKAPTDSQPEAQSTYGLTTLFQGRTWHGDLGAYHYRARWYLPEIGQFAERDPAGPTDSADLYQGFYWNGQNVVDPTGNDVFVFRYGVAKYQVFATIRFLYDDRELTENYVRLQASRYVSAAKRYWALLNPTIFTRFGAARWNASGSYFSVSPSIPYFDDIVFSRLHVERSNMRTIDVHVDNLVRAHEFGHLLGLADFYRDAYKVVPGGILTYPVPKEELGKRARQSLMGTGKVATNADIQDILDPRHSKTELALRKGRIHYFDLRPGHSEQALHRLLELVDNTNKEEARDIVSRLRTTKGEEKVARIVRLLMQRLFNEFCY